MLLAQQKFNANEFLFVSYKNAYTFSHTKTADDRRKCTMCDPAFRLLSPEVHLNKLVRMTHWLTILRGFCRIIEACEFCVTLGHVTRSVCILAYSRLGLNDAGHPADVGRMLVNWVHCRLLKVPKRYGPRCLCLHYLSTVQRNTCKVKCLWWKYFCPDVICSMVCMYISAKIGLLRSLM